MKWLSNPFVSICLIVSLIVLLSLKLCTPVIDYNASETILKALQDSLKVSRNKLNQETGVRTTLQLERDVLLKANFEKDSNLKWLQSVVSSNTKATSAIVARLSAIERGVSKTSVSDIDTSNGQYWPTYTTTWNEEWSKGVLIANKDSFIRDITYFEEYEIWEEKHKDNVQVFWKSLNPNVSLEGLQSYVVPIHTPKKKRFSIGLGTNYGIRIDGSRGVQVGVQGNFNLISF